MHVELGRREGRQVRLGSVLAGLGEFSFRRQKDDMVERQREIYFMGMKTMGAKGWCKMCHI